MPDSPKHTAIPDAPDRNGPGLDSRRRRLLQGGVAVTPLLATLASRPALGQQCLTASAFASGNVSHTGGGGVPCLGRTPGYWKEPQHFSSWTAPYEPTGSTSTARVRPAQGGDQDLSGGTPFHSAVTGFIKGVAGREFGDKSLLDVLRTGGGPPADVGRHVAAALLNAAAGWTVAPTIPAVRDIWNEYAQSGHFTPTAGVQWDNDMICEYLKSTMPY